MLYPRLGAMGQQRLSAARVGVVGCGALGSTIATQLVRAGVGLVRVVDRDFPELNNLHRQTLYTEADVAARTPKAAAAAAHLREMNSDVQVEGVVADINPFSMLSFGEGVDLLVDGTDNFATRFLVNDYAVQRGIPWVYGGVIGASGMTMTIVPGEGPCLRCVFRELPPAGSVPTCDTAGVLGTAVAVVASIQANEVIKLLVEPAARNPALLTVDVWDLRFESLPVERDPECPACGQRLFPFLAAAGEPVVAALCGQDAVQVVPHDGADLDLAVLADRLAAVGPTRRNPFLVEVEVEGLTLTVFADGRAIIKGLRDLTLARSLYARYVGH
jgi:molybdopterin-synthase adenylyltransferase